MKEEEGAVLDEYADHEIMEYANTKIPSFLKWVYLICPIWGIFWMYTFWDGSAGWLDRGYWYELEESANTIPKFNFTIEDSEENLDKVKSS